MPMIRSALPLVAALLAATGGAALAAPKVALVVVVHNGLSDEQTDEIAYDLAGTIATRIEGEAIAGPSVRELLTEGVPPGCEDQPACGRKLAATLKSDEVLFLSMKKAKKHDVSIVAHRVARDPERVPSDGRLVLTGGKANRGHAIMTMVEGLYSPGSVQPYVEPAPAPPRAATSEEEGGEGAEAAPAARPHKKKVVEEARDDRPVYKKGWFWGVVAGGAVVIAGGIVGIVLATAPGPTAPTVALPQ